MRFAPDQERTFLLRAEALGMPPSAECVLTEGDLQDGGIWIDTNVGVIGRKKWVKHRWTIELGGREYAIGQDLNHQVIAFAPAAAKGLLPSLGVVATWAIRLPLLAIILLIWSLVGLFFWIPLVAKATMKFCLTAVYNSLTAPQAGIPSEGLQHAAFFYVAGFRSICRAIIEPHAGEPDSSPPFQLGRFTAEFIWALLFWWAGLFLVSYLGLAFAPSTDLLLYPVEWLGERTAWFMARASELVTLLRQQLNGPGTGGAL